MIPVLFEKDEQDFNSNGLGLLPNILDSYAYEVANSEYELYLEYPTAPYVNDEDNSIWKELKYYERQILYKPSHKRDPHAFRIHNFEIDSEEQVIRVYAQSRAYDLAGNMIKNITVDKVDPTQALLKMKNELQEPTDFSFYSDIVTKSSTTWERQSGLSTIMGEQGSLIQIWGGEVLRENRRISLYNRVGRDNVTTLRLGKNIEQLNYELKTETMVTAVIPFFTYTPEDEKEQKTIIGDTVKSKNFSNYRLPYYIFEEYNEDDGVTDLKSLNRIASRWFNEHDNADEPNITLKVNMVDVAESTEYAEILRKLEQVNVFDTVSVYVEEYNIDTTIKIVSLKYDGYNERNVEVQLGNASKGMFDKFVSPQFDSINKQLEDTKKLGVQAMISADGKSTVYYGVDNPNVSGLEGQNGDFYFRKVGIDKQMWEWSNAQWNLIFDTAELSGVKAEVDEVINQADKDRVTAEEKFNQAVTDAKDYTNQRETAINIELDGAKQAAADSTTTANNAIEKADNAFAKADTAFTKADGAFKEATSATTKATDSLAKAKQAIASGELTDGKLTNITQEVDTVKGQLLNKVETSSFNDLNGRFEQASTKLDQTAKGLTAKAEKTDVDTINKKVKENTAEIKLVPDKVSIGVEESKAYADEVTDGSSVKDKTEILSGTEIYTDKADNGGVAHVDVDGVSYQNAGSGKNLINGSSEEYQELDTNRYYNRLLETPDEFTPISNYNLSGGDTFSYSVYIKTGSLPAQARITHYSSLDYGGKTGEVGNIIYPNSEGWSTLTAILNTNSKYLSVAINSGDDSYTSNIVSYKKSQLEKGEVVTHYEPPAPSPDYPSEITSLNNFDVVSSVGGRNLLPNSKELKVTSNTRYLTYKLSRPIKSGEQYTVSIGSREWITKVKDHNTVLVSSRDAQGDSGIGDGVGKAYGVPIGGSFTLRNDSTNQSIDTILFYGSDINEISGNVEIYKDVKVELGDYSPYSQAPEDILPDTKSDTIYKTNITLPEPLRSVGDVKDRLFRDNAGLLKIERNVGEYTFDGSEGWRFRTNDAGTFVDHNWYQLDIENDNYIDGKGTSSHFKKITTNYNDEEHIRIYGSTVLMWFGVFLKKEKVPDLAVFKKWLASENKKGSPLTVNFLHATPKIETLSQEFQDKLNNIATFKDDNYVYTALDKSDILSPELHATFKSSGWYDRFKLEDTAEKHSAELVIQSDMIATKVASKDYESKMIQLDKEIASKVKSDEYESYKLQTDKIIADKVSSGDFSTYRTQTDKAIVDRVQKGETVSQINIEAGRTLIQSGKILLDGDTYILGTTFANDIKTKSIEAVRADIIELRTRILTANVIESNMLKVDQALINKLTVDEALANRLVAKTAFIQAVKTTSLSADQMTTGILNAAKVNLINMNADNITTGTLTGIELSAVGSSSRFRVRGGDAQFTNDEGQWVNILPTGLYGYDKAGGRRFQVDESLVTSSALGTSVSNVYLAAKTGATSGADGEARVVRYSTLGGDGAVGSYGYLPIRADSLKGAPGVNLYIVTDEEVRITSDNSPSASYKNLRANGLYAGFFTTTTKSMWLGTDSTVHVVAKGSIDKPSNIYRDLRADNLIGNAVVYSGLNGYVGVDNEFRVMNIGLSGTYRDVRAANYIGSAFITSTKNAYIGTDADLLVMDKGLSGSYKDVRAHNFIKASSRELKENITDYNKYTLNNIMELQTVEYNMKESEDKEIGFISEDSPLIASKDGKAVSGYAMDTLALKGIQELTKISNQFDYMLSDHGKEIYCLKQQIKELKKELNK